jgi:hypothetical protein
MEQNIGVSRPGPVPNRASWWASPSDAVNTAESVVRVG